MNTKHLTAGTTLRAIDAIRSPQQTYTRDQVAYLMHLAYLSGRTTRALDDLAELHGTWAEHREPRITREQRVAERIADMEQAARRAAHLEGRAHHDHPGGPVDWHTGQPVQQLGAAA